jgi:hypothetical protein
MVQGAYLEIIIDASDDEYELSDTDTTVTFFKPQ